MPNHTKFILSPITKILEDVVSASAGIGSGIETFPLCDYIMQSVFIKMTGFQEQKMKCVCWELATNDYEYRYDFTKSPLGECSNYNDKQDIYKDLIEQIKKHSATSISIDIDKTDLLKNSISDVKDIFYNTNLSIWIQNSFDEYDTIMNGMKDDCFSNKTSETNEKSMFINCPNCSKYNQKTKPHKCSITSNIKNFKGIYDDHLYRNRNRIAHNSQSYQQNLPTLKTLVNEDYKYENYFIYFTVLVLIDKIFIALYEKYLTAVEEN